MCQYFGQQEVISCLAAVHSILIGRQFLPMLSSLQGPRIALCHISGVCPVEIDRLKMLVR